MKTKRGWRSGTKVFVATIGFVLSSAAHAVDRGTTTGIASFLAKGEVTE